MASLLPIAANSHAHLFQLVESFETSFHPDPGPTF
jgi:hypothetical protein